MHNMHRVGALEHCSRRLFQHWFSTIYKLDTVDFESVHFVFVGNKQKKDCNDSTVWAAIRRHKALMHLTMRLLKTLQKTKRPAQQRRTFVFWLSHSALSLFCCLFIDVAVNLRFKCVCSELLWWYTVYLCKFLWVQITFLCHHVVVFLLLFHVWIKLLFITQTCWTYFFHVLPAG